MKFLLFNKIYLYLNVWNCQTPSKTLPLAYVKIPSPWYLLPFQWPTLVILRAQKPRSWLIIHSLISAGFKWVPRLAQPFVLSHPPDSKKHRNWVNKAFQECASINIWSVFSPRAKKTFGLKKHTGLKKDIWGPGQKDSGWKNTVSGMAKKTRAKK